MSADVNPTPAPLRGRKLWKTALFLAGSGLLGGVALVLWNRKELTEIQSCGSQPVIDEPALELEEEIY